MLSIIPKVADACTGVRLIAKNGQVVFGRTMEWGEFDLGSRVAIMPRGIEFKEVTPEVENGLVWTGKYGVVSLDMLGQQWLADGMNEKGLVIGMFYHPGFAQCPYYVKAKADITITAKQVSN
ncbi:MAG: linear amide C-N hydrolase [Bacteroidota bacterium]